MGDNNIETVLEKSNLFPTIEVEEAEETKEEDYDTTEEEVWEEVFDIYRDAKELEERIIQLSKKCKEGKYAFKDVIDYMGSHVLPGFSIRAPRTDSVYIAITAHPSLYRDYDDDGHLKEGHAPAEDLINRPNPN